MKKSIKRIQFIAAINKQIAENTNKEVRAELVAAFTNLLFSLNCYNGYNYIYWLEKGHSEWIAAGCPQDTSIYLGDKTMVRFY